MAAAINSQDVCVGRKTQLHVAATENNVELCKTLLQRGDVDVGALNSECHSALVLAMLRESWDVLRVLLNCRQDILQVSHLDVPVDHHMNGETLMHKMMTSSHIPDDIIDRFIELGADFAQTDFFGNTALHVDDISAKLFKKISHHDRNIIHQLKNAQNFEGKTPLHIAFSDGKREVTKVLLKLGADVNIQDHELRTPLHYMEVTEKNIAEWSDLIQHVNSSSRSVFGELPPLCWTSRTSSGEITFDTNYRDYLGNTALHQLLKTAFDCKLVDYIDSSLITISNALGHIPIHRLSLKDILANLTKIPNFMSLTDGRGKNCWHKMFIRGADRSFDLSTITHNFNRSHIASQGLTTLDGHGRTPLHYAAMLLMECSKCQYEGCSLYSKCCLELFGVDSLRVKDKYGRTPLHYAYSDEQVLTDEISRSLPTEFSEILQQQLTQTDYDGFTPRDIHQSGTMSLSFDKFVLSNNECAEKKKYYNIEWMRQICKGLCKDVMNICSVAATSDWPALSNLVSKYKAAFAGIPDHVMTMTKTMTEDDEVCHAVSCGVVAAVNSFMERLVAAIGEEDQRLKGRLLAVGSAFEQTRMEGMNEYDFNVELVNVSDICEVMSTSAGQCPPGFLQLARKPAVNNLHEYQEFFHENGSLNTLKLNFAFQAAVIKVLSWQKFWDTEPLLDKTTTDGGHYDLNVRPTKLCSKLFIKFNRPVCDKFIMDEISIDVVPVIHIAGWWPAGGRDVNGDIKSEGCNFTFNQPSRKYRAPFSSTQYVKVSFARAESLLLRKHPITRAAYIIVKYMFSHITAMQPNVHGSLSSHVLKTAALWSSIETNEAELVIESDQLLKHVQMLFAKLFQFNVHDYVPCYFLPSQLFPVYTSEKFIKYSHTLLQRHYLNYEQLFTATGHNYRLEAIKYHRLISFLLHAAFSDGSCDISRIYALSN